MTLTREETIRFFCNLTTRVGGIVFRHGKENDCFCEDSRIEGRPVVHEDVLTWIEEAVRERLKREY